jgi:hypothetical protein
MRAPLIHNGTSALSVQSDDARVPFPATDLVPHKTAQAASGASDATVASGA